MGWKPSLVLLEAVLRDKIVNGASFGFPGSKFVPWSLPELRILLPAGILMLRGSSESDRIGAGIPAIPY